MGRCMENGPVRNNTDTGQPAFRRKTRIQGASGMVFIGCGGTDGVLLYYGRINV